MPKKYSQEFRDHATRMVTDKIAADGCSQRAALCSVGESLGVSPETLRAWLRAGRHSLTPSSVPAESLEQENRRLRRELAEARRANEILKKASAFFAAELDRPGTK